MSIGGLLASNGRLRAPFIRQSEASECGLACLSMVAGYHGLNTDLPALRRRFNLSLKGVTLKTLTSVAEQIGFHCRALRGEISDLGQLPLPAILHWDLNHFVVLSRVRTSLKGTRFEILDPARGKRLLGEASQNSVRASSLGGSWLTPAMGEIQRLGSERLSPD